MGILPMMSHLPNEETSFNRQSLWLAAYIAEFNLSYLAYFFFFLPDTRERARVLVA